MGGGHDGGGGMNRFARLAVWAATWGGRRPPDLVVRRGVPSRDGQDDATAYLRRWYILPRNRLFNAMLHIFAQGDEPVLHDHPWASVGMLLSGEYLEHYDKGDMVTRTRRLGPGRPVFRGPRFLHWLELAKGPAVSVFLTGPRIREWGFIVKDPRNGISRWVHHDDYPGGQE